ncbi:glycosyltransferase family 4 protein [Spirosoma sp. KUDC1026]|uniref:glycosyltransferase family 4 protein n=1 Tax=Spirosoma sp. KUDC1026 TaxID=2745947 RepID=UPI00159BE0DC|nr:glycosyltransferase family 4 protein [Spirosoma sp. KUDC1026]QKZ12680.1 glycosyltransferase family 4 protein [Spirosoma sp. KUDC1026]
MTLLYLTFYFEPDLSAGSFRNTALVKELGHQLRAGDTIHVVTTQPNRYASFRQSAPEKEVYVTPTGCRVIIHRVKVPAHDSGFWGQIMAFWAYFWAAHQLAQWQTYSQVVASSSRLFTAFLGAKLARKQRAGLFLDVRDLFRETILELLKRKLGMLSGLRLGLAPLLWLVERYTFGYATHINLVSEGFQPYFTRYRRATYSYFTNGIDDEFMSQPITLPQTAPVKVLLYAGNIGDGQGLHTIIPAAASELGDDFRFVVIGAGSGLEKLKRSIERKGLTNVTCYPPVSRNELIAYYQRADYLFVHLNDLHAFRRVLPSKLFEYGATNKPIVAGVAGYAAQFVTEYLPNSILFAPGDVTSLVTQLRETPYLTTPRPAFKQLFGRRIIMQAMASCILSKGNPIHTQWLPELKFYKSAWS